MNEGLSRVVGMLEGVKVSVGTGGLPMMVSFSHEGSISERASRSHDDWREKRGTQTVDRINIR